MMSIYDPEPQGDDPWAPAWEIDDPALPPLPRADRTPLLDPQAWRAGQGDCAAALASAAMAVGQLDALVVAMGQGAVARLAAMETEALLWAAGTPVAADELARDLLDARAGTDIEALQKARWAIRRLSGQGDLIDLRRFLGLHLRSDGRRVESPADRGFFARLSDQDFDEAAAELLRDMNGQGALHPIARGAWARTAWTLADLSPEGDVIEAAVWAARVMAEGCTALPFVPLGRAWRRVRQYSGSPVDRLHEHFSAVREGATAARQALLRLQTWVGRATAMTAPIKGDSPAKVIAALTVNPQALTATIEREAGISRDTAERMLVRMQSMGLVREVTGTKRFRVWSART